jgi:hypothetical protein
MNKDSKKRFALSSVFGLGTIVVLFIVLAQIAMACRQALQITTIEAQVDKNLLSQQKSCLDQNCLFVLEKDQYGSFSLKRTDTEGAGYSEQSIGGVDREGKAVRISYFSFYQNEKDPLNEVAFVEALDKLVENDISDIKPVLFQEIENWTKGGKGYFLSGNLTFAPYGQSEESKLLKEKNQLLDCHYTEYKHVGNWLVKNSTSRDYCYLSGGGGGMCPSTVISYPKFFAFLLSDINGTTAPYLAVFIFVILGAVAFATYLIRRKELWFFLRPRKAKIIVTIIAGVLLSLSFLTGISGIEKSLG